MSAPERGGLSLTDGTDLSGLSSRELWLRQLGVGGDMGELEIEAYVLGLLPPDAHHHNMIAQAINEHFVERDEDHPVAYQQVTGRSNLSNLPNV